jgi:hypothetical protein
MRIVTVAVLATLTILPLAAHASPKCTSEPKDKWMGEDVMKSKVEAMGYTIKELEVTGSCYELYGKTADGKKAEIYFNPVTGDIVKSEIGN